MRGATLLCVALFAVASCGGGGGDGGDAATPAPTAAADATATATAAPEPTAVPARRGVRLRRVGTFDAPVYVTSPPGDRARQFVVEQGGRVLVIRDGRRLGTPFLDIGDQVTAGGEVT